MLRKCPRCELNYIRDDEKYCNVCRRDMKGEVDTDDLQTICIECGENLAAPGKELCTYCLRERQRREKLEKLMERPSADELTDMDVDQLDEIDMPISADIPTEELQEIHREFGDEVDDDSSDKDEAEDEEA